MSNTSPLDLHPRFRRLADYLAAKAPPGKLPGRKHIDPAQLVDLLPWMLLIDVVPQPQGDPRYRVRLIGTEVVAIQGSDGTGKYADEILTGVDGADVIRRYGEILETRAPQYLKSIVAIPGREHIPYERVAFPLAADGEHVDMLVLIFARDES
jgi:hypothetical protein